MNNKTINKLLNKPIRDFKKACRSQDKLIVPDRIKTIAFKIYGIKIRD